MRPMKTAHLLHPETLSEGPITRPFHVAVRNSAVALMAIGVGGIIYLVRFAADAGATKWGVFPVVALGSTAVCFGQAYLGSRIGGRRANGVVLMLLLAVLAGLLIWLTQIALPQ